MTFFEQQQKARQKTWILVFYFILAVILIILAVNAVFYYVVITTSAPPPTLSDWMDDAWWIWISTTTLGIIALGSLNTLFKLRGGGRAVARIVGARQVKPETDNLNELQSFGIQKDIRSGTSRCG